MNAPIQLPDAADVTTFHVCSVQDIDEGQAPPTLEHELAVTGAREGNTGLRSWLLAVWTWAGMVEKHHWVLRAAHHPLNLFCYGLEVPSRRRRTPMDVPRMVEVWVEVITGLLASHTREGVDAAEFKMDEALTPILAAPIAQLREFTGALVVRLEADERVPWFVWSPFKRWYEAILKDAKVEEVRALRDDIAAEVAELVTPQIGDGIEAAITAALRWRSPETLERVRDAAKAGGKVKVRGRESCLFLVVDEGQADQVEVML